MNATAPHLGTVELVAHAAEVMQGLGPCPPDCTDNTVHAAGRLLAALARRATEVAEAMPASPQTLETTLPGTVPGWRQAVEVAVRHLGVVPNALQRVGSQVRRIDADAFNRDLWANVIGLGDTPHGVAYAVVWPDGGNALLPVDDPEAVYQWREPE